MPRRSPARPPIKRLFGLVLTGVYLAKGGLAEAGDGRQDRRVALCRFAAENLLSETTRLKDRVVNGAEVSPQPVPYSTEGNP